MTKAHWLVCFCAGILAGVWKIDTGAAVLWAMGAFCSCALVMQFLTENGAK